MHSIRKKLFGEQKYLNKKVGPVRVVYGQGAGLSKGFLAEPVYGADLTVYIGDYMFVLLIPEFWRSYLHKF